MNETTQEAAHEQRGALRRAARTFLDSHASSSRTRAAMATERGWDPAIWSVMARELGWAGLAIPEEYGGAGAGFEDLAVLFEETGRALACAPLLATVGLGAGAVLECGDETQRRAWLPGIATEGETSTLALTETEAGWGADAIQTSAVASDGGWLLRGAKRFVIDGHTADQVVVVARDAGSRGEDGIAAFVVRGDAPGMERRPLATMDQTRRLADVVMTDVSVPARARLAHGDWRRISRVIQRASIALAAEQLGGASRCLEMSVDYAKVRTQFQRPIGSFQAIKHKCADMLVDVECARSASLDAARIAGGEASDDELETASSLARSFCSEAFFRCAAETIQIHGGIGFTWDHDAHLLFKRARASSQIFGSPSHHRDVLARRLGLT